MPKFDRAEVVEQIVWQCRLADWPRALNRTRVNSLTNGAPPWSPQEAEINNIGTNVNDLSASIINHAARRQARNALCVPSPLANISCDYGPSWKRAELNSKVTKYFNRPIMRSPNFLELREGVVAGMVLHGIGPTTWEHPEKWMQTQLGVEDVLIPSNTLRDLSNLPFFAIYRQYTVPTFYKLTSGPANPGWNEEMVIQCKKWIDEQTRTMLGTYWPEVWSPEKMEERIKQDGGLYASDAVPTIDCYDFYFWDDDGKSSGWKRRMVLDAWGQPGVGANFFQYDSNASPDRRKQDFSKGKFLYTSGDRISADKISQIIHFQFGDVSAVSPFRYHSTRGLGFLLYAVCHLQNRLKCKFSDSAFEACLQYFRINNPADVDRLQKIDLTHLGIIPEGLQFVKSEERWNPNDKLILGAMEMNRQTMNDISSSFRQDIEHDQGEETATRTMAKVNSAAELVGSMINNIYAHEQWRYIEFARRFTIKDSCDLDVKQFRLDCLKDGVPESALNSERWEVQMNKVVGAGNSMLQLAIANQLMQARTAFPAESQREILLNWTGIVTGDFDFAHRLLPDRPRTSNSVHDTGLAFGSIMSGGEVVPVPWLNPEEVAATMIQQMANRVQEILNRDGVGTPQELMGLGRAMQYTEQYTQQLAADPAMKQTAAEMADAMGDIANEMKGMAQRQMEQQQNQAQQNGADPAAAAKVQATMMAAQAKAQISEQTHAQKTAQKQIAFDSKQAQEQQKHAQELLNEAQRTQAEIAQDTAKTAAEIRNQRVVAENTPVEQGS